MDSLKRCTKCGIAQSLDAFSPRHDGRFGGYYPQCRACRRAALRAHRARNQEDAHGKARVYARALYRKHAATFGARVAQWKLAHPDRRRAQLRLKKAIESGLVQKLEACSRCATTKLRIEAHHEDYSRPLQVEWLCKPCHIRADRERRKREAAA